MRKITLANLHQIHQQVREHPEVNKQMAGVYLQHAQQPLHFVAATGQFSRRHQGLMGYSS
jgi:hypothetical protein